MYNYVYFVLGLFGNDFLWRVGEVGWDLGRLLILDFEFLNLLIGKFFVDLDLIFLCISEVGSGVELLLFKELDLDVLMGGIFWFWFWLFWELGGGGIRVFEFCVLWDFFSLSSFCISLGEIWWDFFGFFVKGSMGIKVRFGIEVVEVLFLFLIVLSWVFFFVLILFGYKNFFWVLVLWCVYRYNF